MRSYTLRRAVAGDWTFVEFLYALEHVRAHMHAPQRDRWLASLEEPSRIHCIVESDGAPCGHIFYDVLDGWLVTIVGIAVERPGEGAGRFALTAVIEQAFATQQAHRVYLEVLASNLPARRLYESCGFRAEGVFRHGYRDDAGKFHDLVPYGLVSGERNARPPFAGIDHVQLAMPAGEEAKARAFYAGILGCAERPKPPEAAGRGGVWFFSGDVQLHLGVDPDFRPAKKAHPALAVRNFDDLTAALRAARVEVTLDGTPIDGRRHAYFNDPFGNRIEVIAP
jgi:RimJ/RimL family protein N-acetyltransferase/catechol 2,3-dioxygenase-like lactoylglutathione lyase family enzyme